MFEVARRAAELITVGRVNIQTLLRFQDSYENLYHETHPLSCSQPFSFGILLNGSTHNRTHSSPQYFAYGHKGIVSNHNSNTKPAPDQNGSAKKDRPDPDDAHAASQPYANRCAPFCPGFV